MTVEERGLQLEENGRKNSDLHTQFYLNEDGT